MFTAVRRFVPRAAPAALVRRFAAEAAGATAVVRRAAPAFTGVPAVVNGTIGSLSLSEYKGQWVVLFFVPLAFTFVW
jgi:hypothetical protein